MPPVCMRPQIVKDMHEALGHVAKPKLEESLLARWWWPALRLEARQEVARCPMC